MMHLETTNFFLPSTSRPHIL